MRTSMMVVAFLATCLAQGANAQAMRLNGWWVVVASIKDDGTNAPHRKMNAVSKQMLACRIDLFTDTSNKFQGFAPNLLVGVVGAFASEAEAQQQLAQAKRCAPGAYLKRARHLGE